MTATTTTAAVFGLLLRCNFSCRTFVSKSPAPCSSSSTPGSCDARCSTSGPRSRTIFAQPQRATEFRD